MSSVLEYTDMNIRDLIRHYRFLARAAREIGVSRGTLYNWQKHGIPCVHQIRIELKTNGDLKADSTCYEKLDP